MTCFNWTWEYIDEHMTLPRLDALNEYWRRNPPLHQLVAAYAGFKPPNDDNKEPEKTEDLATFMAEMSAANV
jgi:hypothetical protein